ncbi:hypothetical protein ScPMuIL_009550 [Solemya velum]
MDYNKRRWLEQNIEHDNDAFYNPRMYGYPAPYFKDPRSLHYDSTERLRHAGDSSTTSSERTPRRNKLRWALVTVLIIAILGLIGGVVAAVFFTSQSSKMDAIPPTVPTTPKPKPPVEFKASVKLDETWKPELNDQNSVVYQTKKQDFETEMDNYYMNSQLSDRYIGTVVKGFSEGSIQVDYEVKFKPSTSIEADKQKEITPNVVAEVLKEQIEIAQANPDEENKITIEVGTLKLEVITTTPAPTTAGPPALSCPAGKELLNGQCKECRKGFYKTGLNDLACVSCSNGYTTADTGTTDGSYCLCKLLYLCTGMLIAMKVKYKNDCLDKTK